MFSTTTVARLAALTLIAALVSGCGGSDGPAIRKAPDGADPRALPQCPNPTGGPCFGRLRPGARYTTSSHTPAITYAMSEAGWSNDEDLRGNFLLVPPGNTLAGVDAGTSDFIGVYTSVLPARYAELPDCTTRAVEEVASTPAGFAGWLAQQPDLAVTTPIAATVSGLSGVRVDVTLKPGANVPECTEVNSKASVRYRPVMVGVSPSDLEHGFLAEPPVTMRLYLLAHDTGVLCIELDDVGAAPGTLASLSAVAQKLVFTG